MKKLTTLIAVILLTALVISSCTTALIESANNSSTASKSAESTHNSSTATTSTESTTSDTSAGTSTETSSDTSSVPKIDYTVSQMLDALVQYGFIKGDEAKLALNTGITRSQALKIVLRLSNNEDYAQKTNWGSGNTPKHTFTDIGAADEINKYASCALHIGLIKDSGDHKFRGNDNIKANEFVSWLLRALNFDDDFGHFNPNSPWELSNQIELTSGQKDSITFEDVIRYSFTALKTQMKNDSQGMYYYYFVYKRIDVEYPEIFHVNSSDYLVIDKFNSFKIIEVNSEGVGSIYYNGEPTDLSFTVLDPTVASFKFENNSKTSTSTIQNFSIKALKIGQTAIKITFEDENRRVVAFIDVTVNVSK